MPTPWPMDSLEGNASTPTETIGQTQHQCQTLWPTSIWAIHRKRQANSNQTGTRQQHTATIHRPTPTQMEPIILWLICITVATNMQPNAPKHQQHQLLCQQQYYHLVDCPHDIADAEWPFIPYWHCIKWQNTANHNCPMDYTWCSTRPQSQRDDNDTTTQELIMAKPTCYIYQWITNCHNHIINYHKAEKLRDKLKNATSKATLQNNLMSPPQQPPTKTYYVPHNQPNQNNNTGLNNCW